MLTEHCLEDLRSPSELVVSLLASGIAVAFEVHGTSMLPTIRPGDKLVVFPLGEVLPGDVVLMRLVRGLTAHRVTRVLLRDGEVVIVTRGDNADADDGEFGLEVILGKVTCVTRGPRPVRFDGVSRTRILASRMLKDVRALVATLFR